jgi:hypothetical protein
MEHGKNTDGNGDSDSYASHLAQKNQFEKRMVRDWQAFAFPPHPCSVRATNDEIFCVLRKFLTTDSTDFSDETIDFPQITGSGSGRISEIETDGERNRDLPSYPCLPCDPRFSPFGSGHAGLCFIRGENCRGLHSAFGR